MPVELLVGIADKTTQGGRRAGLRRPRTGADAEGGFSFDSEADGQGRCRHPGRRPQLHRHRVGVTVYNAQRESTLCNEDNGYGVPGTYSIQAQVAEPDLAKRSGVRPLRPTGRALLATQFTCDSATHFRALLLRLHGMTNA
ncbi:hypothetical protein ACFQ7J_07810 [Streptomyces sp. NPDC056501]|uniref:hypothetical protein n=1 Tax=Streptomyces sp. NPDC056501 TaxID=3345841 RepID=UPI00367EA5B3